MKVSEIMTRTVEHIRPEDTVEDAAAKMRDLDIGSLPVYDGVRLLGMVSDRDLAIRVVAEGKNPQATAVSEVMSPDVISCAEDDEVDDAAGLMQRRLVRRLIVLDDEGRMTGIVSLGDLATQQSDDELVADTVEEVSEPTHATFFHHASAGIEQGPSDDKGVSG